MTAQTSAPDQISPKQFRESEGVDDWRVLGDGANAYFRTGSLAAGARLVQAIGELPGVDDLQPDVDVRHDGVTVRMVAFVEGYGAAGQEIVNSPLFALYEVLWLLRVFNFERSKEEQGLTRAPGYPAAAVYVRYLAEVLGRVG